MGPRGFLTLGMLLIGGLFTVVANKNALDDIDIWLDRHDSQETAEANALRPLIACINRVDVPWRQYQSKGADRVPEGEYSGAASAYPSLIRLDPAAIRRDICKTDITFKAGLLDSTRELVPTVTAYTKALHDVVGFTAMENDPAVQQAVNSTTGQAIKSRRGEMLLQASNTLRGELERRDAALHTRQLQQIEQRLGRDLHWHTLNYMILARTSIDQLSEAARLKTLTPDLLAETRKRLQQALQAGDYQARSLLDSGHKNAATELWWTLQTPANRHQKALERLEQDWREKATPQTLSDDFWAYTQGYDILLAIYNKQAALDF